MSLNNNKQFQTFKSYPNNKMSENHQAHFYNYHHAKLVQFGGNGNRSNHQHSTNNFGLYQNATAAADNLNLRVNYVEYDDEDDDIEEIDGTIDDDDEKNSDSFYYEITQFNKSKSTFQAINNQLYDDLNTNNTHTHKKPSSYSSQQVTPSLNIMSPWLQSSSKSSCINNRVQEADYSTIRKISRKPNGTIKSHSHRHQQSNFIISASSQASSSTPSSSSSSSSPITTDSSKFIISLNNNKPLNPKPAAIGMQQPSSDSHLLTPLTPHSYSLRQKANSNNNTNNNITQTSSDSDECCPAEDSTQVLLNSRVSLLKKSSANSSLISTEIISPPTLVPFNKFEYYNQMKNTNAAVDMVDSGHGEITHQSNMKSASTSYLLSKISSLASLTIPKTGRLSSINSHTAAATTTNTTTATNPNIITKIFSRKSIGQTTAGECSPNIALSSSSSNSMSSPQQLKQTAPDEVNPETNATTSAKIKTSVKAIKKGSSAKLAAATATNGSMSYSNLPTTNLNGGRSPFNKKRSQSIQNGGNGLECCANTNVKLWFYNKVIDLFKEFYAVIFIKD